MAVYTDNKLDWTKNTKILYEPEQSVFSGEASMFYESVVASAILFAVVCWGSGLKVADANRLNKLIRKASDVVGVELDSHAAVSSWTVSPTHSMTRW